MTDQAPAEPEVSLVDHGVDRLGASLGWFSKRLTRAGVVPRTDSVLGEALTLLGDSRQEALEGARRRFQSAADAQRFWLRVTGADFLSKAIHWGEACGLEGFDEHLRLFRRGDPVLTDTSGRSSKARNGTWELVLASLAATFATEVRPLEPDVLCRLGESQIGLAAKVLYTYSPAGILDRIQEGADQLEDSAADFGVVVANLVELFPHERMFENLVRGAVTSPEAVVEIMRVWAESFMAGIQNEGWIRHLKGRRKLSAVACFIPTVLYLHGSSVPVPYYRIHHLEIAGREEQAMRILEPLNLACQRVLAFTGPPP